MNDCKTVKTKQNLRPLSTELAVKNLAELFSAEKFP